MYNNKYELMLITETTATEEEKKQEVTFVNDLLVSLGAKDVKTTIMGDRKLAYLIKKQGQGYYFYFNFSMQSSNTAIVEEKLNARETVLRFMMIKDEKEKVMQKMAAKEEIRNKNREKTGRVPYDPSKANEESNNEGNRSRGGYVRRNNRPTGDGKYERGNSSYRRKSTYNAESKTENRENLPEQSVNSTENN